MRVLCRKTLDASGAAVERSVWLTVGSTYVVLEVITVRGELAYRLEADAPESESYGIHLARAFDVVCGFLPSAWVFDYDGTGVALAPLEWRRDGFWEDFYAGDATARATFERRKREIYASEPPYLEP